MKKLWDKPYKRFIYVSTIMLLSFSEVTFSKNLYEHNIPVSNSIIIDDKESKVEDIEHKIQRNKEIISDKQKTAEPLTQKQIINNFVTDIASKYGFEPELIMSIIEQESDYNPNCTTGECLGLMQISSRWHSQRASKLGVTDFYDPYGNILLGVDYLSELLTRYKDINLVLMLYNMNHDTAFNLYKNGQTTYYVRTVLERANQLKKGE